MLIDFVIKKDEKYYLKVLECKYIEKEKMMIRYIPDDLNFSSDGSDKSDEE